MRDRDRPAFLVLVVAIFAFGLGARVVLVDVAQPQEVSDAGEYRELAIGMLDHGEYGTIGSSGWNNGLTFRAYRPPGYPLVRAGLMAVFGREARPAIWLNVLSELLAMVFVFATARRLLGRAGAVWASLIFATFVLFTASLMTESLSMALWAVLAWSAATRAHTERVWIAIVTGVLVGVAILIRPISIFWIVALAWPIRALERRPRLVQLASFVTPIVLLVGAWALRNRTVFGSVVWMSTNLGVHNAPDFGIPWQRLSALRHEGLDEPSADRALQHEIFDVVAAEPTRGFAVYGTRLSDLFSITPDNCWELQFARSTVYRASPVAVRALDYAVTVWRGVHVLALVAATKAALTPRSRVRPLVLPFVLFVLLQCLLSRGDVRLVAPAVPLLCVFAARMLQRKE